MISRIKRSTLSAAAIPLLLVLAFSNLFAQDQHPATVLIEASVTDFMTFLREDPNVGDKEHFRAKLEEIVVPRVDFLTMTKLVVGKHWRRADEVQREALVAEFTEFLLNTYTAAVVEYREGEVVFEPFVPQERKDRAVVETRLTLAGSNDIPVIYKLRDKQGWLIYDIEVSQLSLVTNYRASFAAEIEARGIDGLVETLHQRNQGEGDGA